MCATEPRLRIGRDRVTKEAAVREPRQSRFRLVTARVRRLRYGPDPVLRKRPVWLGLASQRAEQRAAAVEAVDAVRQESLRRFPDWLNRSSISRAIGGAKRGGGR